MKSVDQLQNFLASNNEEIFILGGGSNILLTKDIGHVVLKNDIKERTVVSTKKDQIIVRAGGGENWHRFVRWCVRMGYGGLENLSLIPGSVGAAPMQNIGAYGVEIKDVFHSLEAVNIKTGKLKTFKKAACKFGYRTSVFKTNLKDKYFITSVCFKLSTNPKLTLSYGAVSTELQKRKIANPSIDDVSKVIMDIRRSKLPDPKIIGNAGSFFKNPVVSTRKANLVKKDYSNMPAYPQGNGKFKLSAGWLIQECGWKGKSFGGAACYKKHALILINKKNAKPQELVELSKRIQQSVKQKFGIDLVPEVNFIG